MLSCVKWLARRAMPSSPWGGLSRRRNPPFTYAKKAGYAFGYNPPYALQIDLFFRENVLHGRTLQQSLLHRSKVLEFLHRVASAQSPSIEHQ